MTALCRLFRALTVTLAPLLAAGPAAAQTTPPLAEPAAPGTQGADAPGFQVCNQSFDVVNLAIAEPRPEGGFRSRGWWRLAPNQCIAAIEEALPSRYIYAFATDVFGRAVLPGVVPMCIAPRRFVIEGAGDCEIRGYIAAPFQEIDTGAARRWTLFLAARPG